MKKIITYLFALLISNIYSQCDNYDESQCSIYQRCEWVEDIEEVTCASLAWNEELCESAPECTYWCDDGGGYFGWCDPYCSGGMTYIDNGYCQEVEILECFEMDEVECSSEDSCEWVENLEIENCYDILDCTGGCTWQDCEAIEGCNWHFGTAYYDPSYCYGEHEVDNSYCEEIVIPECSEMNELECSSDNSCNWVDNIEIGSCSSLSASECSQYFDDGCSLGADCIQWGSWYSWICYEYGPSYCTGGNIDIGNSYCEEIQYQLGDLNQDSIINIQDVIIIINFILNGEFDLVADINLDSIVNVLDVIQLVNIILNN